MTNHTDPSATNLGSVFDAHVKHEFVDRDVKATMRTMVEEPSKIAGGYDGIADFAHGGRKTGRR